MQTPNLAYIFNASRSALVQEATSKIQGELVPAHNAECEDIRREADEIAKSNQALAKTKKRARILRLCAKKWEVINGVKILFMNDIRDAVEDLNGKIEVRQIEGSEQPVEYAVFPDASETKMPRGLFIDFTKFEKA